MADTVLGWIRAAALLCVAVQLAAPAAARAQRDMQTNYEQLWSDEQYAEYFDQARNEIRSLLQLATVPVDRFEQALSLAETVVARQVDPVVLGSQIDLAAKRDIVAALVGCQLDTTAEAGRVADLRRRTDALAAAFAKAIDAEIIPDFESEPAAFNVAPPAGVPGGIAGMAPDAIADPKLRAEYEAAIRENRMRGVNTSRQPFLRRVLAEIRPPPDAKPPEPGPGPVPVDPPEGTGDGDSSAPPTEAGANEGGNVWPWVLVVALGGAVGVWWLVSRGRALVGS